MRKNSARGPSIETSPAQRQPGVLRNLAARGIPREPLARPTCRSTAIVSALCWCAILSVTASCSSATETVQPDLETAVDSAPEVLEHRTESLRGQVVWLADALERLLGVKTVPEARERVLALETVEGEIHPIVEDLRGGSFRIDRRLRQMNVELLVRRHRRLPMIQIIRIHEVTEDGIFLVDYWCDVCSIVMFEDGPCSCCQDRNRLRKRRLPEAGND